MGLRCAAARSWLRARRETPLRIGAWPECVRRRAAQRRRRAARPAAGRRPRAQGAPRAGGRGGGRRPAGRGAGEGAAADHARDQRGHAPVPAAARAHPPRARPRHARRLPPAGRRRHLHLRLEPAQARRAPARPPLPPCSGAARRLLAPAWTGYPHRRGRTHSLRGCPPSGARPLARAPGAPCQSGGRRTPQSGHARACGAHGAARRPRRSPEYWARPNSFDPDRFPLDAPVPTEVTENFAYLPFGGGKRKCIGAPRSAPCGKCLAPLLPGPARPRPGRAGPASRRTAPAGGRPSPAPP